MIIQSPTVLGSCSFAVSDSNASFRDFFYFNFSDLGLLKVVTRIIGMSY